MIQYEKNTVVELGGFKPIPMTDKKEYRK